MDWNNLRDNGTNDLISSWRDKGTVRKSKYNHCVYLRNVQDGSYIYLLLYVDDMLIAAKIQGEIEKLKA